MPILISINTPKTCMFKNVLTGTSTIYVSNWKLLSDKFRIKLYFTQHRHWFISQEFGSDTHHEIMLISLFCLSFCCWFFSSIWKRESQVWINTVLFYDWKLNSSDSSHGKWRNMKKEGKQKERGGTDCTVFHLLTLPEKTFLNRLLMPRLFLKARPAILRGHTFALFLFFLMLRLSNTVQCNIQSTLGIRGNTPNILF